VQVANQVVGLGVHHHQLIEGHPFASVLGVELTIEHPSEIDHGGLGVDLSEVIL
jgi:hypothetical protein